MKYALVLLLPSVLALVASCASSDAGSKTSSEGASPSVPDDDRPAPAPTPAPAPDATERSLQETSWRLVEVAGKPAIPGLGARNASIAFERDSGSVRGNSGLNSFFGPYALDGAELRIENLGMTRMAGAPELMAQETAFVAALQAARRFRISGETLELLDAQQTLLARLVAVAD